MATQRKKIAGAWSNTFFKFSSPMYVVQSAIDAFDGDSGWCRNSSKSELKPTKSIIMTCLYHNSYKKDMSALHLHSCN